MGVISNMPYRVRHSRSAKVDTTFRVHRENAWNRQSESERRKSFIKSSEEKYNTWKRHLKTIRSNDIGTSRLLWEGALS